jgi:hydroxymethylglutaryl-CoA lyase
MQIESVDIALDDKVRLLDALSGTGLRNIVVGSFVSPRWVPQMAEVEQLIERFAPVDGVTYTALVLNARGAERRQAFAPPITVPDAVRTQLHLCDVFVRRNTGRSQADEIAAMPDQIAAAVAAGRTDAIMAVNAAWGSNWLGPFTLEQRLDLIALELDAWHAHGVTPHKLWLGDPMSWCTPRAVEETVAAVLRRWPAFTQIHLHLHDGRGLALLSAYQVLRMLGPDRTLVVDTSIGGMGGCPYCGNGRTTRMIATEDFVHLLEVEGIDTGIDVAKLVEAAWLAEEVVGHELYGHVSKAGPLPGRDALYDMDMPLVETFEQAQHFRRGPSAYDGCLRPWKQPITSPARPAVPDEGDPHPVEPWDLGPHEDGGEA